MSDPTIALADRLAAAVRRCGNPVCVGLDPRADQLPETLRQGLDTSDREGVAQAFGQFCREVIDVVAPVVPAVKPQAAFFEQIGPAGMQTLARVIQYAREKGLLVILDAKRNDIGSTAIAYADAYLGVNDSAWGADALTVNPYLGGDSLEPFVEIAASRGAGVFVLVKTSNPGSGLFQELVCQEAPLYLHVARHVAALASQSIAACGYSSVGAVVGATFPGHLEQLRSVMPHSWLLVPGFGSQGGRATDVASAFDQHGLGALINNARGIIFAYERAEFARQFAPHQWQRAVDAATRQMIDQLAAETPAGKLRVEGRGSRVES